MEVHREFTDETDRSLLQFAAGAETSKGGASTGEGSIDG